MKRINMKKMFYVLSVVFVFFLSCSESSNNIYDDNVEKREDKDPVEDSDTMSDLNDNEYVDDDHETPDNAPGKWCGELSAGVNKGPKIETSERVFNLVLPSGEMPESGWPVIFSWHGVGDTMENFKNLLDPHVDNKIMSFIAVTPENDPEYSMSGQIPKGIDWDILDITDGSVDALFFDEILACLKENYKIDENRIYSTGFSAGAINVNALGILRSEVLASVLTYSGGYLGNNKDQLDTAASIVSWPSLYTENRYVEMRVHGGENDFFDLSVTKIHFDEMAENDQYMLNNKGHDAIICSHDKGHVVDGVSVQGLLTFFRDHPRGTLDSPYGESFPEDYFEACEFFEKF